MDSGAYTLFNDFVEKRRDKRIGKHGKELERPMVRRGQGDYSWYDLSKGSEFRRYCDRYASFMKKMEGRILFVNVDAIQNPDLTWETQRFFEEEHGVQPVPVVHGLTPMKYLHRYLDTGRYDLIGLGGLGHHVPFSSYIDWADEVFLAICPESKEYLPQVRVHGFAMTSWKLMCRWPFWSVDSATWVKLAAYGWLYVPRWEQDRWRFDKPPMQINVSSGAPGEEEDLGFSVVAADNRSPMGRKPDKHVDNVSSVIKEVVFRWVKKCGVEEGTVDEEGKMEEFGVRSHFRARSICNLHYFKDLEESSPKWPWPLDPQIIKQHRVDYHRGFGIW